MGFSFTQTIKVLAHGFNILQSSLSMKSTMLKKMKEKMKVTAAIYSIKSSQHT